MTGGTENDAVELQSTQSAYDRSPCGLLTIKKDGRILEANQTFRDWLVLGADDDLPGFLELLRMGDRIFWGTHVAPLLDIQGFVNEIAVELSTPGGPLPSLLNAITSAPGDQDGTIDLAIFSAQDRRAYERELLAERKIAEQAEARARDLAATLQQSLIPPNLPVIPGLALGAAYRPAGDGTEVGGDWYDVFQIDASTWILSIGDVVGKGASAAALTAFIRHTIRGVCMETNDLAVVLSDVNRAMMLGPSDRTVTVALAKIELGSQVPALTICSAGHPLPRMVSKDENVSTVGEPGPLLGAFPDVKYTTVQRELVPGETYVLFTDGLLEARRDDDEFYGEERLEAALASHSLLDPPALAEFLRDEAVEFQSGVASDDIAVVAFRRTE